MKTNMPLAGLLVLSATGCRDCLPITDTCLAGYTMVDSECVPVPDAGAVDAGDAGPRDADDAAVVDEGVDEGTPDAGPCGMPCAGTTPVCDEARGMCAECTVADDAACTGATPVCDTVSGSLTEGNCVPCNADSDCTTLTAAQCDVATHTCVPCTGDAACASRTETTVCGAGACVQCTGADRTACGTNVCDVTARTCSTSPLASAQLCESCVSDAQCQTGQVCVAMSGDSPTRVLGHYCLWLESATGPGAPSGACSTARPYIQGADRTALEAGAVRVCEPAIATCEALLDFRSPSVPCTPPLPGVANDACGATDVDDGYCQVFSGATNGCTVACTDYRDCPDLPGTACYRCTASYCSFTTGTESGGTCM